MPFDNKMLAALRAMGGTGGGGSGGDEESEVYIIHATATGSTIKSHDGDYITAMEYFSAGKPVIVEKTYIGAAGIDYYVAFTHEPQYERLYFNPCVDKTDSTTTMYCLCLRSSNALESSTRHLLPQWPKDTATAADVLKGKTFYKGATGELLTGTHECTDYPNAEEASF